MRRVITLATLAVVAGLAAAAAPAPAAAQEAVSKLSIHGYLTQAYARSDGFQTTFAGRSCTLATVSRRTSRSLALLQPQ